MTDSLESREPLLEAFLEQLPGLFWTTDRNLRTTSSWGAGLGSCGIRAGDLVGKTVCEFFGCPDSYSIPAAEFAEALSGASSLFEYPWEGRVLEIRVEPLRAPSGQITGCLALAFDVTARKKSEEQAVYQARHDALTGLANYREFMDRLEAEVRRAERGHHRFALLLFDLDDLKRINDRQGHLAGNNALKRLAAVMSEHCRSTDLAARYGGDEFAVILIDADVGMAEHVARRINYRLRTASEKSPLSVSIGVSVYPDDGRSCAELLESADQRLYQRKRSSATRTASAF